MFLTVNLLKFQKSLPILNFFLQCNSKRNLEKVSLLSSVSLDKRTVAPKSHDGTLTAGEKNCTKDQGD